MARAPRRNVAPQPPWYLRFGNIAQICAAVVGLVGFSIVIMQIQENRNRTQQESYRAELADARRSYMAYTDSTLKYPELTDPDYDALLRNHNDYVRYQNFFLHMLYAYDEMLHLAPLVNSVSETEWVLAFELDLEPHQRYVCRMPDPRIIKTYRPAMQARLEKARTRCAGTEPLIEQRPRS
jgi:hypothetical protein